MDKRLTKSDDKCIAGVCSGIADYLGIDPTIVRVGWALLTCCTGIGLVAYIVCAIVMPDEKSI